MLSLTCLDEEIDENSQFMRYFITEAFSFEADVHACLLQLTK
jgi:hypothetical protein